MAGRGVDGIRAQRLDVVEATAATTGIDHVHGTPISCSLAANTVVCGAKQQKKNNK